MFSNATKSESLTGPLDGFFCLISSLKYDKKNIKVDYFSRTLEYTDLVAKQFAIFMIQGTLDIVYICDIHVQADCSCSEVEDSTVSLK